MVSRFLKAGKCGENPNRVFYGGGEAAFVEIKNVFILFFLVITTLDSTIPGLHGTGQKVCGGWWCVNLY